MTKDNIIRLYYTLSEYLEDEDIGERTIEYIEKMTDEEAVRIIDNPKEYYLCVLEHEEDLLSYAEETRKKIHEIIDSINDRVIKPLAAKIALRMCNADVDDEQLISILKTVSEIKFPLLIKAISNIIDDENVTAYLKYDQQLLKIVNIIAVSKNPDLISYTERFIMEIPEDNLNLPSTLKIIQKLVNAKGDTQANFGLQVARLKENAIQDIADDKYREKRGKEIVKMVSMITTEKNEKKVPYIFEILTARGIHNKRAYELGRIIKESKTAEHAQFALATAKKIYNKSIANPDYINKLTRIVSRTNHLFQAVDAASVVNSELGDAAFEGVCDIADLCQFTYYVAHSAGEKQSRLARETILDNKYIYLNKDFSSFINAACAICVEEDLPKAQYLYDIINNSILISTGKALKYFNKFLDTNLRLEISNTEIDEIIRKAPNLIVSDANERLQLYDIFTIKEDFWEMFRYDPKCAIKALEESSIKDNEDVNKDTKVRVRK